MPVDLGAAAERIFLNSFHRHRRFSSASLSSDTPGETTRTDSDGEYVSSDSSEDDEGQKKQKGYGGVFSGISRTISVRPAGDLQASLLEPSSSGGGGGGSMRENPGRRSRSSACVPAAVVAAGSKEARWGTQAAHSPPRWGAVAALLLLVSTWVAYASLWLGIYDFNLDTLIKSEQESLATGKLGEAASDLAAVHLCVGLLVLATGCCARPSQGRRSRNGCCGWGSDHMKWLGRGVRLAIFVVGAGSLWAFLKLLLLLATNDSVDALLLRLVLLGSAWFFGVADIWLLTKLADVSNAVVLEWLRLGVGTMVLAFAFVFTFTAFATGGSALLGPAGENGRSTSRVSRGMPPAVFVLACLVLAWLEGVSVAVLRAAGKPLVDGTGMPHLAALTAAGGLPNTLGTTENSVSSQHLMSFLAGQRLLSILFVALALHSASVPAFPTAPAWTARVFGGTALPAATLVGSCVLLPPCLLATGRPERFLRRPLTVWTIKLCKYVNGLSFVNMWTIKLCNGRV